MSNNYQLRQLGISLMILCLSSACLSVGKSKSSSALSVSKNPPSGLTYSASSAVYTVSVPIEPNSPTTAGGTPTSYSISPALPQGLTLNTTTGIISGTPSATVANKTYTITATNKDGSTTKTISLSTTFFPDSGATAYTVPGANTVINSYTYITDAAVPAGSTFFNVNDASSFAAGDEILIIQNHGPTTPLPWELATVHSVAANKITVAAGLGKSYASGTFSVAQNGSLATQVVKVPHYSNVNIPGGTSIVADPWNMQQGGVVAFRASGTLTINGGSIIASARGYAGGGSGSWWSMSGMVDVCVHAQCAYAGVGESYGGASWWSSVFRV